MGLVGVGRNNGVRIGEEEEDDDDDEDEDEDLDDDDEGRLV